MVCMSVCVSVTTVCCAKAAELIEMTSGILTVVGPRKSRSFAGMGTCERDHIGFFQVAAKQHSK